jgi:exodeoxyribonuclease VII small subunit
MGGKGIVPAACYLGSPGRVSRPVARGSGLARPKRRGRTAYNGGFSESQLIMSQVPFKTPASYEAALEELDQLVGLIESGQLPLEQLLTGYQRGAELLQFCRDKLQAVENQIKVLDEGTLKPWTQE